MRKLFFILLISATAYLPSFSQSLEFAPVGATWHYTIWNFGPSSTEIITSEAEDTLYNKPCKRLSDGNYVYRDSLTIYYCNSNLTGWSVLYDFSKEVGDSFTIRVYDFGAGLLDSIVITVTEKGDTTINNKLVPYINMQPNNYYCRLYGRAYLNIGLVDTYFFPFCVTDPEPCCLACYTGDIAFGDWLLIEPCDISSVEDVSGIAVDVSPNPTTDRLRIESPNENINYTIYDVTGKLRLEGTKENDIDVSALLPGMYFINLRVDDKSFTKKFIKQ